MIDRAWLLANLPHQGAMCLLDAVHTHDATHIHAVARSHHDPTNPLRHDGRLGISAGIEYAAQAMAAHGRLLAPVDALPRPGRLIGVRDVTFFCAALDSAGPRLDIHAERLLGDADTVIYQFTVADQGEPLLSGRATVILQSDGLKP